MWKQAMDETDLTEVAAQPAMRPGLSRRAALGTIAGGTALAWAAPTSTTIGSRALASGGAGSERPNHSFDDNFDEDTRELGVTSTTHFNVGLGNIDVIGPGLYDLFPGYGNYIDLGGTY